MTSADQDFGSQRQRGDGRRGPAHAKTSPRWPDGGAGPYAAQGTFAMDPPQAGGDPRFGRQDPRYAGPPAHEDYYQADYYQPEYPGWTGQPAPEADYPGRTQQPAYGDEYPDPGWIRQPVPQQEYPDWGGQPAPQADYPGWTQRPAPQADYPGWTRAARVPGRVPRLDRAVPARVPRAVRPVRPPSRSSQLARIPVRALARRGPADRPRAVRGGGRAAAAGTGAAALHPPARFPSPRRRPSARARPAQGYPAAPGHGFPLGADHAGHHHRRRQLGAARRRLRAARPRADLGRRIIAAGRLDHRRRQPAGGRDHPPGAQSGVELAGRRAAGGGRACPADRRAGRADDRGGRAPGRRDTGDHDEAHDRADRNGRVRHPEPQPGAASTGISPAGTRAVNVLTAGVDADDDEANRAAGRQPGSGTGRTGAGARGPAGRAAAAHAPAATTAPRRRPGRRARPTPSPGSTRPCA